MTLPLITMRMVAALVAKEFGITSSVMVTASRQGTMVRARQVTMHLFVTELGKSLHEVGRFFEGKDHTTVLHAVGRIAGLIETDPALADRIGRIKSQIRAAEAAMLSPPAPVSASEADRTAMLSGPVSTAEVVIAIPASLGRLTQAVDEYLQARKQLEGDQFSAHEAPSRRVEEQKLSVLRVAYHDFLAGGRAS